MCKTPKPPPAPVERRPSFLRNPILDSAEGSTIGQLRIGRSALRTDIDQTPIAPIKITAPEFVPERFRTRNAGDLMDDIAPSLPSLAIGSGF